MTAPPPPPSGNPAMVRALLIAIAVMTVAIVVLFAAIVARLIHPRAERAERAPAASGSEAAETIDFGAAPEVEIGMPPGVRVLETHLAADRATFLVETPDGGRAIYTAPLTARRGPVKLNIP